ncbi:MAG: ABC transporter ATP-binding protein [Acutalibacteraceae bacterium]|nr:ABC transporter ATP-binding protein [Acutalibacteraceae bacterium]
MAKKESNKNTLKWIYARTKKYLPLIIAVSVVTAFSACTGVGIALVTKRIFDIATKDSKGSLVFAGLTLFAIIAAQVVLSAVQSFLSAYANGKLTVSLRSYLFTSVLKKKYSSLASFHSGDILNRFTSDTEVVVSGAVSIIPSVTSMVTKIVTGIGAMLVLNPYLAIIILLLGIAVPAIGRVINKRYKRLHKECQKTEGKTRAFLQECFENVVVIKSFVSEKPFKARLGSFMDENFKLKMKRTSVSVLAHICLYSFFTVGYYAVLVWGAGSIAAGTITYGTLMAFLQLISQLRAPLQNVSGIMPKYYSALASAERLMELEDLENEEPALSEGKINALKSDFLRLEVNNVSFSYGGEEILENCSFTAEKGHITALTGESGSGKSTLFKLILGLYEPRSGSITVNGETEVDTSIRGLFSYVPQGNMVLSGTVRDNITLCDPNIAEEKIINAAKAAEIYDYIAALPEGFDTVLSERGAGLSEGQLQRISIARALLNDAPVLLLDEATSALDEATETKVLGNIKNMTDKTVIFITHRNTSLKVCDKIVRVENKKFTVIK